MQYADGTNRITSSSIPGVDSTSYDAAGNLRFDGMNAIAYDAENRVCAVRNVNGTVTQYLYNADGQRVAKGYSRSGAGMVCPALGDFAPSEKYILGPSGEQITKLVTQPDGSDQWQHTNVYASGQLIATYDQEGSQQLLHFDGSDLLGTRRVQASASGTVELSFSNLPYGDGFTPAGSGQDATQHHFTGKERDTESGLDYFGARYYASTMGRWMSPDWASIPVAIPYADINNPQSLNLYSYVKNNPLIGKDADGHEVLCGPDLWNPAASTLTAGKCIDLPDPYPRPIQAFLNWRQNFIDTTGRNAAAHAAPKQTEHFGVEEIAQALMAIGGGFRYSRYDDVTNKGSVKNVDTDVTASDAGKNLEANGYTKSTASDGTPTYTKGNTQYTVYSNANSAGGPTAQVKINGEVVAKIRLK